MRYLTLVAIVLATVIPAVASALVIRPDDDFFDDVRRSSPEAPGIYLLVRESIIQGYGNRTFGTARLINRAEFLKIAMSAAEADLTSGRDCFPDVRATDWFARYACAAKERGVISGKTFPVRYIGQTYFDPAEGVTYGEALKMLSLLFAYDVAPASGHWAEGYERAARDRGVDLPVTIDLDTQLTRARAARLAAAFLAENHGQLQELRLAESGIFASSSSSSSRMSSSRSSFSTSSTHSSSLSSVVLPTDPLSESEIRSQLLLLGDVSPIIGAAKIFLSEEPFIVQEISINLSPSASSIQSLLVYDENRRFLGRATLQSGSNYRLEVATNALIIEKSDEHRIYVRAHLSPYNAGGISGQDIAIQNIVVMGSGYWSNHAYTKSSTETFLTFETARSTITGVTNVGPASAGLVGSSNQIIGAFRFESRKTDASAVTEITELRFQIEQTGGVTLSNVSIGMPGIPDRHACTVSSQIITCSGIPASFGSLTDETLTMQVFADVSVPATQNASLRLTINDPGSASSTGAITWTDGSASHSWVGLLQPVVMGTYYSY